MTATSRCWLCLCCWLVFLPLSAVAGVTDYGFSIIRAELKPDEAGGGLNLDADIDYRFSEPAIDALRNGVSLTLILRLNIHQERDWWWDTTVLNEDYAFRVRYHALSKLYQIIDGNDEAPRNFVSINALLEAMGTVRSLPMAQGLVLSHGERYRASLVVGLDIEALPLPLRPVAYVTPAWYLKSTVYQWTFVN